jgi:hypothetical protein
MLIRKLDHIPLGTIKNIIIVTPFVIWRYKYRRESHEFWFHSLLFYPIFKEKSPFFVVEIIKLCSHYRKCGKVSCKVILFVQVYWLAHQEMMREWNLNVDYFANEPEHVYRFYVLESVNTWKNKATLLKFFMPHSHMAVNSQVLCQWTMEVSFYGFLCPVFPFDIVCTEFLLKYGMYI